MLSESLRNDQLDVSGGCDSSCNLHIEIGFNFVVGEAVGALNAGIRSIENNIARREVIRQSEDRSVGFHVGDIEVGILAIPMVAPVPDGADIIGGRSGNRDRNVVNLAKSPGPTA
jgi:hypothetical protein